MCDTKTTGFFICIDMNLISIFKTTKNVRLIYDDFYELPLVDTIYENLLMAQLGYWAVKYPKGFYKFTEPCDHRLYKVGESWSEELRMTKYIFATSFSAIGTSYKSRKELDEVVGDKFKGKYFLSYQDRVNHTTYYHANIKLINKHLSEYVFDRKDADHLTSGSQNFSLPASQDFSLGQVENFDFDIAKNTSKNTQIDVGAPKNFEDTKSNETHVFEENETPVTPIIRGYPKTFAVSKKNGMSPNSKHSMSSKFSGSLNDSDMDIEEHCVDMDNSAHVNRLTSKAGIGATNGTKSLTRQSVAFSGDPENEEYLEEGNARGMKVDRLTFENEVISQLKKAVKHNDLVAICGDLGMVDIQDLVRAFAEDFASGKGKEKNLVFRDKSKANDYRYNSSVKGIGIYFKKWVDSVSPEKLIRDKKVTVDFSKEDELAKKLRDFCLSPAYGHKQARNYFKRPESGIKEDLETVKSWLRDGWKEDDIVKLVCVFTWTTGSDYTYPALTVSPQQLRYLWKELNVEASFNPEKNERIRSHYNYYYTNK